MPTKLSDADVANIRKRAAEGESASQLAGDFGVSRRHVGRIIRGDARPQLGGLDRDTIAVANVRVAVDRFLADLDLTPGDLVLAETARTLGDKLDQVRESWTAASAAAAPQLAYRLVETVAALRGDEGEPDALDDLQRRREARLLAAGVAV
jgi:transcriptional regulator with XRE-family HTH domain